MTDKDIVKFTTEHVYSKNALEKIAAAAGKGSKIVEGETAKIVSIEGQNVTVQRRLKNENGTVETVEKVPKDKFVVKKNHSYNFIR